MQDIDVPVLIVGAGGSGLTASMLLADLGVASFTISRSASTSDLPKAHVLQQRSMEIFRTLGVADDIYGRSTPAVNMASTAWYAGLAGEDAERGRLLHRMEAWGGGGADPAWVRASACRSANLPQIRLEPVLRAHAESRSPASIRFNQELIDVEQDADGVTATVLDRVSGERSVIRSQYLLACDGGRTVGRTVGIELEGPTELLYSVSVHMSADLSQWAHDPDVLIRWVMVPENGMLAVLVPMGPERWGPDSEEWVYHLNYPAQDPRAFDDDQVLADMRLVLGIPDFRPEIHRITRWAFEALLAPRFRAGRVFLVGDAAHRHGPTGGLGLNSAIQDAHNLSWKLAAVLGGLAGDGLLDTYEAERRPVDARNVQRATENATHHAVIGEALGIGPMASAEENWAQLRRMWGTSPADVEHRRGVQQVIRLQSQEFSELNVELGYAYSSDAVVPDGTPAPDTVDDVRLHEPDARPGARVPHALLEDASGARFPLLDLVQPGTFLLLAGEHAEPWCRAAAEVAAELGVPIRALRVGHADGDVFDPRLEWTRQSGTSTQGAVLVRPDHVVCWRSAGAADDPVAELGRALRTVLASASAGRTLLPYARPDLGDGADASPHSRL